MQKKSNAQSAKNAIVNPAKKEIKEIASINLSKFSDQLKNVELREKKIRETLYVYPEGRGKEWINSEDGKKFRNSLRNQMKRFSNNILTFAKIQDMEKLQKEIASFQSFYKTNYRMNDFSIGSITNSSDPIKERDFILMLDICKEIIK